MAEAAFLRDYLSKYRSPLADYAMQIVLDSEAQGLDDRFIVALAGVESTYGTTQHRESWGYYNVFSNGRHCADLSNPLCKVVNPYTSFPQAISDVTKLIGSSSLYSDYSSARDVYSIYEVGDVKKTSGAQGILDQIYGKQLGGNLNNITAVQDRTDL